MSPKNKDFYGKDVAEAIKLACNHFGVAQENLTIEVLETGSKGIFGLIRQRAHIRAAIQDGEEAVIEQPRKKTRPKPAAPPKTDKPSPPAQEDLPAAPEKREAPVVAEPAPAPADKPEEKAPREKTAAAEPLEFSDEALDTVKAELAAILELMGFPSTVNVEFDGTTVNCRVGDEHQELLTSQDGRVLDSLQYLLRKIISKKISGRVQLSIDVGNYREKRYQELQQLAVDYSAQVKEDGKTQVIASLNPSERRVVHVALQDDPDIRSRSVGDGLFKKVLIYKPGKGKKSNGRRRGRSRNRKKSENGSTSESS
jgi:spoIIIJ-associated protein